MISVGSFTSLAHYLIKADIQILLSF